MTEQHLLQPLHELGLKEGKRYLQECCDKLEQHALISAWLEKEALDRLYEPFISLKLAELLIFLGEYVHDRTAYALGLKAKGDALVQIGHYKAAMESLDEAGAIFVQQGDERNWARSRISWVVACAWLGHIEEALYEAQQAREVFLRLGEPFWACTIDNNRAVIYDHAGRHQEALELYESMRITYLSLDDQDGISVRRNIALVDLNQAINLARMGYFAEAYTLQCQARDSFRELAEVNLQLIAEVNIADLDYMQGYYGSALRRYYHALDVAHHSSLNDLSRIAKLKLWTANCLLKLNRAQEARQLSNEAVTLYRQFDISLSTGLALLTHATTLAACKHTEKAIEALSEAEELFSRAGFEHHTVTAQLQKAELLLEIPDASAAYTQARLIKVAFESRGPVVYIIRAELIMASALLAMINQPDTNSEQRDMWVQEAEQLCKHLAPLARKRHLQEAMYKCYYLLGRIASLQKNMGQTGRYYQAAIAQIERILDDLLYDLSPAFLRTAWAVYGDMIEFCLEHDQVERAFTYLEQTRSLALRQYLIHPAQTREQAEKQDAGDVLVSTVRLTFLRAQEELKDWQDRYRHYSILLSHLDPSVSASINRETIQAELKGCENKISELFERLALYQAEWPPLTHTSRGMKRLEQRHFDLARLHQNLAEHQTLLAYFLHKKKLIIFAMNAQKLIWHEISDGVEQLEKVLPFLYAHIQMDSWFQQQSLQQRVTQALLQEQRPQIEAGPRQQPPQQQVIRALLQELYALLIAPVRALLPEPEGLLTIVPYGPLHNLPFHALFDGARFLIEDFQLQYLLTSNLLSFKHVPGISLDAPDEKGKTASALLLGYSGSGQLPYALEEAKLLAAILQGKCYLEEKATIARLEEEAPGSSIIHIATHGQSRLDAPNFSSILLADGQFNAIDAFNLKLQGCELITLSGCETGFSFSSGGDEQLGLGRAFLAAGAETLVMSLWSVEDKMTGEFMELFYRTLLQGESKVQALRTVQCEFLSRTESPYAHPYFWAAFRLVGDIHPLKHFPSPA